MSLRREFLKGYILTLVTSGELKLSDSPGASLRKLWGSVSEDFSEALAEILSVASEQGAEHVAKRLGPLGPLATELFRRTKKAIQEKGFSGWWRQMNEDYKRGAEAMGKPKRKDRE